MPDGVDLVGACYSTGLVDLIYTNEQSDKMFIINLSHFPSDDGTPVELSGGLVGHVVELPNSKGGSSYLIQFEKAGWTYSVAATLGKNYGLPDNTVTPGEAQSRRHLDCRAIAAGCRLLAPVRHAVPRRH